MSRWLYWGEVHSTPVPHTPEGPSSVNEGTTVWLQAVLQGPHSPDSRGTSQTRLPPWAGYVAWEMGQ